MRAAIFNGPRDITVGERPDPVVQGPTDAVVRLTLACVCGSDLWYYRGESPHGQGAIGHEFVDAMDTGVRGGPNQDALDFRSFGVKIPEA